MSHPIPKDMRDRFDQIERDIMGNKMERDAVFTQMRTAVQAYFMSAEPVDAIPLSDCVPGWHSDYNDGLFATDDAVVKLYRHPPEVDRLNTVVEQQKSLIASLRAELTESYSIDGAERRNAQLSSTLEECITEMSLALQDHAVRSAMTVVGRTRFLKLVQDHNTQPAESGAST